MGSKKRISLFDQWASDYDQSVERRQTFPFDGYEEVLDQIVKAADVTEKGLVLDLGTGTGNLAKRFLSAGCTVWATDFSPQMLAQGRLKLPQVHFVEADLLGGWPDELPAHFDRIVSAYVLHEFDLATKMKLLKRMAASLTDDGRIVIGDIAFPTAHIREQAHQQLADVWDEEEFYWAADEAIRACEEVGLLLSYQQISSCAGVFVMKAKMNDDW